MAPHFALFLGISLLVIMAPGQDMALVTRNTLFGERRSGVFTAMGVVSGLTTWSVASALGLAALLSASEPAFLAIKLIGAAYLACIGLQALYSALVSRKWKEAASGAGASRHIPASTAFRQGIISNLGNPKIAVFFTSLLPQFTVHGAPFLVLLLYGLTFCALTLLWLTGYAVVVARAGDFLRQPRMRRTLEGITGVVLLGLGLRLATEHR